MVGVRSSRDTDGVARLAVSRWAGFAGAVGLAAAGYAGGALPEANLRSTLGSILRDQPGAVVLFLAGAGLLCWAWARLAKTALTVRWVLVTAALWAVPLLVAPPLTSRDVYAYACQGETFASGLSPYEQGVAALPCTWLDTVSHIWRDTPAPYGPGFVLIAGAVAGLAGGNLLAAVALFRVAALGGLLLIAWQLPVLARRCGVAEDRALWLGLAGPLTGLHLVSGAHNDALMMGFVLAGLAVAAGPAAREVAGPDSNWWRRALVAGALFGLALSIKVTAVVAAPFAALLLARPARFAPAGPLAATGGYGRSTHAVLPPGYRPAAGATAPAPPPSEPQPPPRTTQSPETPPSPPQRLTRPSSAELTALLARPALLIAATATLTLLLISAATGLGLGWLGGLARSGDSSQWTSLPTGAGWGLDYLGKLFGVHGLAKTTVPAARALAVLALAAILVTLFFRTLKKASTSTGTSASRDIVVSAGWALAWTVLLAPVFHPWYALWPLLVLAAGGTAYKEMVFGSVFLTFLVLPDGFNLARVTKLPGSLLMLLLALGGTILLLRRGTRAWARRRAAHRPL
ncbi:polyprenol phosphomannose-dependent alpha 1,6 mannosyltransferase MptB [Longispora albida]|uniref:polyprenol phosphomannose-dependent alpha 1,6 mannosyltransferase MptB n=1 Tax=Longispora albida TaxID=203523 RepID=UPI0006863871|nr:polyprenol phosphomannose-dependent alpha 1,6 mannosyltransferase MptB [Longispora albida]